MATTLPKRTPTPADRAAPSIAPGGGRQRRWSLALVAVLVTLGSALAFVVLWMNAGDRQPVLAMANDVATGQVIQESDLKVVRVSADAGVTLVSDSAIDQVVDQPATADLLAGSLLVPEAVGSNDGVDSGTTVIAIPVPSSEVPSDDLERGDRVILLQTPDGGGSAAETTASELGEATVASVAEGSSGGDVRISVTVDEDLAPAIAGAVSRDSIYVAQAAAG